jgi:hypothetical protein
MRRIAQPYPLGNRERTVKDVMALTASTTKSSDRCEGGIPVVHAASCARPLREEGQWLRIGCKTVRLGDWTVQQYRSVK